MHVDVQVACADSAGTPSVQQFTEWVRAVLDHIRHAPGDVTIRITDADEMTTLNRNYRGKPGPTNVLSFPFEPIPGIAEDVLGDLVICAPVVVEEARGRNRPEPDHWAHLAVHGVLHLCGLDHQTEAEAGAMEQIEREVLATLGIPDPYAGQR